MLDYKQKYKEIKSQMLRSSDLAYRLGYQKGLEDGQMEAMQQQMAQQQQMMAQQQAAMQGGGQPGQEEPSEEEMQQMQQEEGMQEEGDPNAQVPLDDEEQLEPGQVSELDNHINELEALVAKGQKPSVMDMRKAVSNLSDIRKSQKAKMKQEQPKINTAQKQLVEGILKKWESESKATSETLEEIISKEGLKF